MWCVVSRSAELGKNDFINLMEKPLFFLVNLAAIYGIFDFFYAVREIESDSKKSVFIIGYSFALLCLM